MSDPIAAADALQFQCGEGPSLAVVKDGQPSLAHFAGAGAESRWPRFAQALRTETPVREALAFAMLRSSSQNLNRKLRDVAQEVAEIGMLPQ